MLARTPNFVHELNSRSAWVRMSSSVNYQGNNTLAKKYVMQGGTLNNATSLKYGLGSGGASAYDSQSPGGTTNRLGIRPMPGITNVSIQSKGAYGSLQEATVSYIAWDIAQLEELEILYMRPGYTVLLEFGWDYINPLPKWDILNKKDISLNDAFRDIYTSIKSSRGNYDALLGYVKNYNWSARADGGYDCTTTIISLGEVLESLKCNWVPLETNAFDVNGLGLFKLNLASPTQDPTIINSYEQGIIPGLLHELWYFTSERTTSNSPNYSFTFRDPTFGTDYKLYMAKSLGSVEKNDRGGLTRYLGSDGVEGWITLGSFCDLLNNYVLLKGANNNPISQITTYETDAAGNIDRTNSLDCIASPLSISTNLGVCLVNNPAWASLSATIPSGSTPTPLPAPVTTGNEFTNLLVASDPSIGTDNTRFKKAITKIKLPPIIIGGIPVPGTARDIYKYNYNLKEGLDYLATGLVNLIDKIEIIPGTKLQYKFTLSTGASFISTNPNPTTNINLFDLLSTYNAIPAALYVRLFVANYDDPKRGFGTDDPFDDSDIPVKDSTGKEYTRADVISLIKTIFENAPLNAKLQALATAAIPNAASATANIAANTPGLTSGTLPFVNPNTLNTKCLGNINNIYINMNFLYQCAISKNIASNDNQNQNTISIRDFLQTVLREVQNSLGNINNFDIQVDSRNAIGRIIDINFTGETLKDPFTLQIHNLSSIVRNYSFQSKIFPEMGSIIAISAQDASGVGKLGYDNATLVAWNENITDRLIPKKNFSTDIEIAKGTNPSSFILPFLTKMYSYFQAIRGVDSNNINFAFGGLNFAYRDFLANLSRFDERNKTKTIIPTELSITLDGIGGIVIGNLFQINQDIVPKSYKGGVGRKLAYIVTKLGHSVSNNDWTTTLSAYPIIFETAKGTNVAKNWKNQQYPGSLILSAGSAGYVIRGGAGNTSAFSNQSSIRTAIKFFQNKGFSNEAAAALVGSFLQESALDPAIVNINKGLAYNASEQTYAAGIAQWIGPRRTKLLEFAKSKGINITNYAEAVKIKDNRNKTPNSGAIITAAFRNIPLETQLEFINQELPLYSGFTRFKTSTNLSSNVIWVYETYEGGNYTPGAALGSRDIWAADLVARIKKGDFK
jgi:hypothetical protein